MLGQSLQSSGKMEDAIAAWKKTLEIDPNHSQALYSLFRNLAKKSPEEAKTYEKHFQALQQQSGVMERAQTLSNFGLAAANSGDWPKALAQLREAIQICGNCGSSAMLHKMGLTECRAGHLDEGEKELRLALEGLPNDPDILKALDILKNLRAQAVRKP